MENREKEVNMAGIIRIINRIKLSNIGLVYSYVYLDKTSYKLDDVLYDLQGNRFRIKRFALIRRMDSEATDYLKGGDLTLENLDGADVSGSILLKEKGPINFIFCNHPLYPRKVDEDYQEEYQTAGLNHPCALFSYEDLESGKLSLYGECVTGLTIYRGWMMKPQLYRLFYEKLKEKGIILINTPEEYEKYHMLPGWYEDFKENTAESVWDNDNTVESAILLTTNLEGSYIVKDYVKSRKHEWHDACFIPQIKDKANAEKIIKNFITRQDDSLIGGVVLRKFENLKSIGYHEKSGMPISEEYRAFAFAGKVIVIDGYWTNEEKLNLSIEELKWIDKCAGMLKSNFATIDLARREDGKLIIVELGDGQVSGLQQIDVNRFYDAFQNIMK